MISLHVASIEAYTYKVLTPIYTSISLTMPNLLTTHMNTEETHVQQRACIAICSKHILQGRHLLTSPLESIAVTLRHMLILGLHGR